MRSKKISIRGRVIIGVNTFACLMIVFMQRVNINVVIAQIVTINKDSSDKIHWTAAEKSYTLMSYYAGFFFTQIPCGMLAEKYGAKIMLGISIFTSSLLCLVTPSALERSPVTLTVVRILMGASHGPYFPCSNLIMVNWYPPGFRTTAVGLIIPGMLFGSLMAFSITSAFALNNALWRCSFYLFGSLGFLWLIFWMIFTTDDHLNSKWIKDDEKDYLTANIERKKISNKFPIKKAIRSLPLLATICFHFQAFWSITFILTISPSLIKDLYYIPVKNQTYITFLCPILTWISGFLSCTISDFFLRKKILSKLNIRKFFGSISCLPIGVFFMLSTLISPNMSYLGIILILVACFITGIQLAVIIPNFGDIAPQFCGTIAAISNTICSIAAILSIQTTYMIVSDTHNVREWQIVFGLLMSLQALTYVIFMSFVSSKIQSWAIPVENSS